MSRAVTLVEGGTDQSEDERTKRAVSRARSILHSVDPLYRARMKDHAKDKARVQTLTGELQAMTEEVVDLRKNNLALLDEKTPKVQLVEKGDIEISVWSVPQRGGDVILGRHMIKVKVGNRISVVVDTDARHRRQPHEAAVLLARVLGLRTVKCYTATHSWWVTEPPDSKAQIKLIETMDAT